MPPRRDYWTNQSVLAFAKETDPVEAITNHARKVVLSAVEAGWKGPPFSPFELAQILKVPVRPHEDVYDGGGSPVPVPGACPRAADRNAPISSIGEFTPRHGPGRPQRVRQAKSGIAKRSWRPTADAELSRPGCVIPSWMNP